MENHGTWMKIAYDGINRLDLDGRPYFLGLKWRLNATHTRATHTRTRYQMHFGTWCHPKGSNNKPQITLIIEGYVCPSRFSFNLAPFHPPLSACDISGPSDVFRTFHYGHLVALNHLRQAETKITNWMWWRTGKVQLTFPWRCTKRTDMNRCRRDGEREKERKRERYRYIIYPTQN